MRVLLVARGMPSTLGVVPSLWSVSTGRGGEQWAVYYDGRVVVDGYQRASEAWWAVSFLARGRLPAYVPEGVEVDWPLDRGDRRAG